MLHQLQLIQFHSGVSHQVDHQPDLFVLKTCQRTLWLTFDKSSLHLGESNLMLTGEKAYQYLLEIIIGLQSRLLGESEIVNQFKTAYHSYAKQIDRDPRILKILEKLFQDSKEIRTEYFAGFAQKTYASITRKHFLAQKNFKRIFILGSGQLAIDLINQFKKKAEVVICARNQDTVKRLCQEHQICSIPWGEWELVAKESFIANTIGFEGVLLDQMFFDQWKTLHSARLFVDLASPSPIQSSLSKAEGFIPLDHILSQGAILESNKLLQIEKSKEAVINISRKRLLQLEEKQIKWHPSLVPTNGNHRIASV